MATTWSSNGDRSVKAACTTGSESAPSAATEGISLDGVGSVSIFLESVVAETVAGGVIALYVLNDKTGVWAAWADKASITIPAGAVRSYYAVVSVVGMRGRLAAVPSGVTIGASGATVFLNATAPSGRAI